MMKKNLKIFGLFAFMVGTVGLLNGHIAFADNFSAGRIIDDYIFTNNSSMNTDQIQNFLNAKVPTCDTWGTQPSEYGGGTRRQWAESRGHSAPFTCLKDYSENGKRSAQIINDISQTYRINPQVLIVLLQKEQGLVTDTWPVDTQYKTATGYGCPDTAPCDSQYYGLTNQLTWAAKMFRAISDASPTWYTPYLVGNNFIRYSPDSACGGSNVNIENRATQALYNYTPYQPNQAVINSAMGQTVPCGAYGNINFYRYFTAWFGSTRVNGKLLQKSLGSYQIGRNTTIRAGEYIVSPNGRFVTTMQYDGNLVTYVGDKAVWNSGTYGYYGNYATFQNDGNFVVYRADGSYGGWNSGTQGTGADSVTLNGDGNIIIAAGGTQKWNTNNRVNQQAINFAGTQIGSSARLNAGDYLKSPDGLYSLVMQNDGNLVLYTADNVSIWNSKTYNKPGSYATLQNDGNFVIYSASGAAIWNSQTWSGGASTLKLQDDGNLVLYTNSANSATWYSDTYANNNFGVINYRGTSLASGATLNPGDHLRSSDFRYVLVMQYDGNLVLYSVNNYTPIWNSKTYKNPGSYATLQSDGNFIVYSNKGNALWYSRTWANGLSTLKLQSDGNLVLYTNSNNSATWYSDTYGAF